MNAWSCFRHLCVPVLLVASFVARGQIIVAPAAAEGWQATDPAMRAQGKPKPAGSNIASALASDLPLYSRGPFAFRPHFLYRALRATGLEAAPGLQLETTTQTVAPGLAVEGGEHWRLDYTPSWTFYSNRAFENSSDQSVDVAGTYDYNAWAFRLSGGYSSTHPTLVETAHQTHEERLGIDLNAHRRLTERTQLDLAVGQSSRKASPLTSGPDWVPSNAREWSSSDAIRYQATERIGVSAGMTFGRSDPSVGPSMTFTRPEIRVLWSPTERISFNGQAGFEERRLQGDTNGKLSAPVYTAGLRYRPFVATTVMFDVTRGMALSYLADQVTKSESWRAGLEQRFLTRFYAETSVMKQKTRFIQTERTITTLRNDQYTTFEARLGAVVLKRGAVAIFYQRTRNSSSQAGYAFTASQTGVEFTYRF